MCGRSRLSLQEAKMRAFVAVLFASMMAVVAALGGVESPAGPAATGQAPAEAGPVATEPALAQLRVSAIGMDPPNPKGGGLVYAVRFRITEVSGLSGAVVKSVAISPGGTATEACWGTPLRVEAANSSDAFRAVPAVAQCAPMINLYPVPPVPFEFTITITYVDDFGRRSTVSAHVVTDETETWLIVDRYTLTPG